MNDTHRTYCIYCMYVVYVCLVRVSLLLFAHCVYMHSTLSVLGLRQKCKQDLYMDGSNSVRLIHVKCCVIEV